MSSKLVLPRKDESGEYYLSYSQLSTWKRNKRDYIRQYFFGEKFEGNAFTEFGSLVGEALETASWDEFPEFNEEEIAFLKTVPRYDQFEMLITLHLKGFYVKGYVDTNTFPQIYTTTDETYDYIATIADYKTGDIEKKKSEYESDSYNQLEIYSAGLEQMFGKLPDAAYVYLIGREGKAFGKNTLKLTKEYETIVKEITPERIDAVKKDIQETAEEISRYYKTFLKLKSDE